MNYEKLIINPAGDKIKIHVTFFILSTNEPTYRIELSICPKGKRLFKRLEFDNWSYRKLSMEERRAYEHTEYLTFVTEEQIQEAKIELWHKLSPK